MNKLMYVVLVPLMTLIVSMLAQTPPSPRSSAAQMAPTMGMTGDRQGVDVTRPSTVPSTEGYRD